MKLKRGKAYRKQMAYLHLNFQFREPYQVLVDEEIVIEAVKTKYDLVAGLERTLQGKTKVMISQCTMEHLYRSKNEEAINLAKTFERRRCGHIPKDDATLSSFECIRSIVDINGKNKHRYCVATQKPKLRQRFRQIPAIPLIYINRSVMILEPMSPATEKARQEIESAKLHTGLNTIRAKEDDKEAEPLRRTRKAKGPNPLSVKKRSRDAIGDENDAGEESQKRRRKRGKKKTSTDGPLTPEGDDSE